MHSATRPDGTTGGAARASLLARCAVASPDPVSSMHFFCLTRRSPHSLPAFLTACALESVTNPIVVLPTFLCCDMGHVINHIDGPRWSLVAHFAPDAVRPSLPANVGRCRVRQERREPEGMGIGRATEPGGAVPGFGSGTTNRNRTCI